jgi:hypothetical protein
VNWNLLKLQQFNKGITTRADETASGVAMCGRKTVEFKKHRKNVKLTVRINTASLYVCDARQVRNS